MFYSYRDRIEEYQHYDKPVHKLTLDRVADLYPKRGVARMGIGMSRNWAYLKCFVALQHFANGPRRLFLPTQNDWLEWSMQIDCAHSKRVGSVHAVCNFGEDADECM